MKAILAKIPRDDLPLIRLSLILLGLSIGTGAGAIWGSVRYEKGVEARHQAAMARVSQARARLEQANEEQRKIERYRPRYRALAAQGWIGEEARLEWIEAIRDAAKRRKLFPVTYEIAPQRTLPPDAAPGLGSLELTASRMTLKLPLLHEEDLLNLLADLQHSGKGFFTIHRCAISRNPAQTPGELQPNLEGECELDWLTLGGGE